MKLDFPCQTIFLLVGKNKDKWFCSKFLVSALRRVLTASGQSDQFTKVEEYWSVVCQWGILDVSTGMLKMSEDTPRCTYSLTGVYICICCPFVKLFPYICTYFRFEKAYIELIRLS